MSETRGAEGEAPLDETGAAGRRWRSLWPAPVALLVLIAGAGVGMAPVWEGLHEHWTTAWVYTHGYLVLAMAVWLGWWVWTRNPPARLAPDWWWLLPVVGLVGLLALMELVFLNVPRLYLVPPLAFAVAALVMGRTAAQRLIPALLVLSFAIPYWDVLERPLQLLTIAAVGIALRAGDVPTIIAGDLVRLPVGTFQIAGGCAGVNYLVVGMVLTAFYGLAFLSTWRRRLLLFAVAVVVGMFANWIRVYVIIVAGYVTGMQHYLVQVDHLAFGWAVFSVAFLPVLWLGFRLERPALAPRRPPPQRRAWSPAVIGAAAAAALVLAGPRLAVSPSSSEDLSVGTRLPDTTAAGEVRGDAGSPWRGSFRNGQEDRATYYGTASPVNVYRAVYPRQDRDHRLIWYGNSFTGEGWRTIRQRALSARLGGGQAHVLEQEGEFEGERRLMWSWYTVAGATTIDALDARMLYVRGLLTGRRDAVATAVSVACGDTCDSARERIAQFVAGSAESLRWEPETQP
jgi:EpsI family protein